MASRSLQLPKLNISRDHERTRKCIAMERFIHDHEKRGEIVQDVHPEKPKPFVKKLIKINSSDSYIVKLCSTHEKDLTLKAKAVGVRSFLDTTWKKPQTDSSTYNIMLSPCRYVDFLDWYMQNICNKITNTSTIAEKHDARNKLRRVLLNIVNQVHKLHKARIAHLDVKPENIIVDEDMNVNLIDFEYSQESTCSCVSNKHVCAPFMGSQGTFEYAAPEVKRGFAYGFSVDVYAIGIIMNKIIRKNEDDVYQLIKNMTAKDPSKRPHLDEVKKHKWFQRRVYV